MINLIKSGKSVDFKDVTLIALYKFFKDEAGISDRDALEAAEAVIRLQDEGRLNEILALAREGKE